MKYSQSYNPNWISTPADTILDLVEEKNLDFTDVRLKLNLTQKEADDLLTGELEINDQLATCLTNILGGSKLFWQARDIQYREELSRQNNDENDFKKWIQVLPINDMVKFGWIDCGRKLADRIDQCQKFFNITTPKEWYEINRNVLNYTAFRTSKSFPSNPASVVAWLRKGELDSYKYNLKTWNPIGFKNDFEKIRRLTLIKNPEDFLPELEDICLNNGVCPLVIPAPKGCRASGATFFNRNNNAVILLSARYLSDDHFWFTFFHEAGHLILHEKNDIFIEGIEKDTDLEEVEANNFARDLLIPVRYQARLMTFNAKTWISLVRFAKEIGISPGIIVGQLQKQGVIRYNQLNKLKNKYRWINY